MEVIKERMENKTKEKNRNEEGRKNWKEISRQK